MFRSTLSIIGRVVHHRDHAITSFTGVHAINGSINRSLLTQARRLGAVSWSKNRRQKTDVRKTRRCKIDNKSREGLGLYDSTMTGEPSVMPMRNERMVLAQTVRRYCGQRRATTLGTCPGVFRTAARGSLRAKLAQALLKPGTGHGTCPYNSGTHERRKLAQRGSSIIRKGVRGSRAEIHEG